MDTVDANLALGFRADPRDYGVGMQILQDLGLGKVRLLTNNPKKTDAFVYHGHGLEVVEQVPIIAPDHDDRRAYLDAKRDRMGHILPSRRPPPPPTDRDDILDASGPGIGDETDPGPFHRGVVPCDESESP